MKINKNKKLLFLVLSVIRLTCMQQPVVNNQNNNGMFAMNTIAPIGSVIQNSVNTLFDEEKYLQDKLSYLRAYKQLQDIVVVLANEVTKQYEAIMANRPILPIFKNNELLVQYDKGRYLQKIIS